MTTAALPLTWFGIVRLGLVQTGLGAVVVLTTSTLNRVMVVELALPAVLPGLLVGMHYALQVLRPRFGFGSDQGGRRTSWILGGMAALSAGGLLAALATAWMTTNLIAGLLLAMVAFTLIGVGVGAAGTSLLVLLAKRVEPGRRAAAATIVWTMMIAGFIATAACGGAVLDPFSLTRLVAFAVGVSAFAFLVAVVAVWGIEGPAGPVEPPAAEAGFRRALSEVWAEPRARAFTVFVFVSMLAYSAQDLILEPFAGLAFGYTPAQSTALSGLQNAGVLGGMVAVALLATGARGRRFGSLRGWTVFGCVGSGAALASLAFAGIAAGAQFPLKPAVVLLGLCNGAFAVAAIAMMMELAGAGRRRREGVRMGLWGSAQAIAFGLGGLLGAAAADLARAALGSPAIAYGVVFAAEACLFLCAAALAANLDRHGAATLASPLPLAPADLAKG